MDELAATAGAVWSAVLDVILVMVFVINAKLVCQGLSNQEIAEALRIRQGTVKTHIKNIYRRIRVKNKVALLLRFMADVSKVLGESAGRAVVPIVDAEA